MVKANINVRLPKIITDIL